MFITRLFIFFFLLIFWEISAQAITKWQDLGGKTHFLLLDIPMTSSDLHRACRKQGWDVFNYEYLTPSEQENFRNSEPIRNAEWTTLYPGQPSERNEIMFWMSSEFTLISEDHRVNVSTLRLQRFINETQVRPMLEWQNSVSDAKYSSLCMYQSHTWQGCSHQYECTYEKEDGGQWINRYSLYEYGPTRSVALSRMQKRVQNIYIDLGGRCEFSFASPLCVSFR